jgi:hypothetical protein
MDTVMMQTASAQLPEGGGEDRVYVTSDAVIVLDGASAFLPVTVPPSAYVDALGNNLLDQLKDTAALQTALREAIRATARQLGLEPGHSPSSTVTMVRKTTADMECLVLGDSLIAFPDQTIIDERISHVAQHYRTRYRDRLRSGHGYDQDHREMLRKLQAAQARHRNRANGYWIAEADPAAADHAFTVKRSLASTPWAVLATDGAYKTMTHLGLTDWSTIATASSEALHQILTDCQRWEDVSDPDGRKFPRAKPHDDKSLAATRLVLQKEGKKKTLRLVGGICEECSPAKQQPCDNFLYGFKGTPRRGVPRAVRR